jgi:hypothetical protein
MLREENKLLGSFIILSPSNVSKECGAHAFAGLLTTARTWIATVQAAA